MSAPVYRGAWASSPAQVPALILWQHWQVGLPLSLQH